MHGRGLVLPLLAGEPEEQRAEKHRQAGAKRNHGGQSDAHAGEREPTFRRDAKHFEEDPDQGRQQRSPLGRLG